MANRSQRKKIAEDTLEILRNGVYSTSGANVVLIKEDIENCDKHTRIMDRNYWDQLFTKLADPLQFRGRMCDNTKFEVTDELSIASCKRLHEEGYKNITCLNFASAKHPCGGMVRGSIAQEESLGLCSTLYSSLNKQDIHYDANKQNPVNGLYQDSLIYSPGCVVFRDDTNYNLLEDPFKVNFISCPAANLSVTRVPLGKVKDTMLRRTKAILATAADEGCDVLVLGAWGTGVFQNSVKDVAAYFKENLIPNSMASGADQNTISFENIFPTVVFALGKDKVNQKEFRSAFLPNLVAEEM